MKKTGIRRKISKGLPIVLFLTTLTVIPASAMQIELADAPDTNLDLTTSAILSAKNNLLINIYELDSPQIVDAILSQVKAGVKIQILEEGNPVGGLSAAEKGVQNQLVQAMRGKKGDLFFEMGANVKAKRRFHFDHAKYIVVDGTSLLIGSENYSPTGNPVPGSVGNRGWEVFIHDPATTVQFMNMFAADTDLSYGDVTELTSNSLKSCKDGALSSSHPMFSSGAPVVSASAVEKISSPEDSVTKVVAAIQSAKVSIDIEQMSFYYQWSKVASPIFTAVAAAAKRGVTVRVLLNDDSVFDHPNSPPSVHQNQITADAFNALAKNGAKVTAVIANLPAMGVDYIHNKGLLIDGNETLISSINWDGNSFQNNRETAVLITSSEVNQFYSALFTKDWQASNAKANLVAPPADQCPQTLHVKIDNIQVQIADSEDQDFNSLKNLKVDGDFVAQDATSCTYEPAASRLLVAEERSFLQIRRSSKGVTSLVYEGYTPKSEKLFSIRSKLTDDQILGVHPAEIFDGSGPSKEALGKAVLELK